MTPSDLWSSLPHEALKAQAPRLSCAVNLSLNHSASNTVSHSVRSLGWPRTHWVAILLPHPPICFLFTQRMKVNLPILIVSNRINFLKLNFLVQGLWFSVLPYCPWKICLKCLSISSVLEHGLVLNNIFVHFAPEKDILFCIYLVSWRGSSCCCLVWVRLFACTCCFFCHLAQSAECSNQVLHSV